VLRSSRKVVRRSIKSETDVSNRKGFLLGTTAAGGLSDSGNPGERGKAEVKRSRFKERTGEEKGFSSTKDSKPQLRPQGEKRLKETGWGE